MIEAFERSVALNPSSTLVLKCAGEGLAMADESEAAIEKLERAMRLSPSDPAAYWTYHGFALAHFSERRYEEAVEWAGRAVLQNPEFTFALRALAAGLAHLGRIEEARQGMERVTALDAEFTLSGGRRVMLTGRPELAERYLEGLRVAGMSSLSQ